MVSFSHNYSQDRAQGLVVPHRAAVLQYDHDGGRPCWEEVYPGMYSREGYTTRCIDQGIPPGV